MRHCSFGRRFSCNAVIPPKNKMKRILIIITITIFVSCSESSDKNEQIDLHQLMKFPKQTTLTKSIIDSLGNVNEYKQNGFILYCKNGSYSDKNRELLFTQIYDAILRIKEVLKIEQLQQGFYLIMLDSREEMGRIFGHKYKGLSIKNDDLALFVNNSEIRPYFKHELFHLIAYQVWGNSDSRLLNEGGAVYADNQCLSYKNPIGVINRYLYEKKKWFPFDELINNFTEKAAENDMIAYLESAYIFKHLYENYGKEKMIELWRKGFSEIKNIYGFDVLRLENNIYEEMIQIEYKEVDWSKLMEEGCG